MKAINDRVIIRVGYMPESVSGIVLATQTIDNGRLALNIGKVISAGDGAVLRTGELIPVKVKEGDVVVWEQFGSIRFEILGPDIVCVRSEDIGAVMDEVDWKGRYLFDPEEIKAYQEKIEKEREAFKAKQMEQQEKFNRECKKYSCENQDCRMPPRVKKHLDRLPGDDLKCIYCGVDMVEDKEPVAAPAIIIK